MHGAFTRWYAITTRNLAVLTKFNTRRPRMAAHLRLVTRQRRTRPGARLMSRRTCARRRQRLRVLLASARFAAHTKRRCPRCCSAHPHRVVQRAGVRAGGLLPEHGVRERGAEGEPAGRDPVRFADTGYQLEAEGDAVPDQVVRNGSAWL